MAKVLEKYDLVDQIVDKLVIHVFNVPTKLQELQRQAESNILEMLSDSGVFSRQKTRMIEDISSCAMDYSDNYRDLPRDLFKSFRILPTDDRESLARKQRRYEFLQSVNWGMHAAPCIPGHMYECQLDTDALEDQELESWYIQEELKEDHVNELGKFSKKSWNTWKQNARKVAMEYGYIPQKTKYASYTIQELRCFYILDYCNMLNYKGEASQYAHTEFLVKPEIIQELCDSPIAFWYSDDFGDLGKKQDILSKEMQEKQDQKRRKQELFDSLFQEALLDLDIEDELEKARTAKALIEINHDDFEDDNQELDDSDFWAQYNGENQDDE